jgi:hypothetical protein
MKLIFYLFNILPFYAAAQTAHIRDKELDYRGTFSPDTVNAKEQMEQGLRHIRSLGGQYRVDTVEWKNAHELQIKAQIVLPGPYADRRWAHYVLDLGTGKDGLTYHLHKLVIWQQVPGRPLQQISSKELVEGLESSGNPAIRTEQQLNEIDMKIQRVLAALKEGQGGI